jgi:hypothetical protein
MYKNGMEESWKYWGVYTDTGFASYLAQPAIHLAGSDNLQKICEQEWAVHYPNGPRGWTVWRRTGFPGLIPASASTSHSIPRRIPYGSNEYSTNNENVSNAAGQYTINGEQDSQYGSVWWDVH